MSVYPTDLPVGCDKSSTVGANPWKEFYAYVSGIFSSSDGGSQFFQTFDASIPH